MTAAQQRHRYTFLLIAFGAVLLSLSGVAVPSAFQVPLLVVGVALLGIPHGALDPVVAHHAGLVGGRTAMLRLTAIYTGLAALTLVVWWVSATATFVAFLFLSVLHFADDWASELRLVLRLLVASITVSGPALFWPDQTCEIFEVLVSARSAALITDVGAVAGLASIGACAFVAVTRRRSNRALALEVAALPLLAWSLPPLLFFTVYFCALHSPRHLIDTLQTITTPLRTSIAIGGALTAVTLLLASVAYLVVPIDNIVDRHLQVVFIGLAALTVPHMWLLWRARR